MSIAVDLEICPQLIAPTLRVPGAPLLLPPIGFVYCYALWKYTGARSLACGPLAPSLCVYKVRTLVCSLFLSLQPCQHGDIMVLGCVPAKLWHCLGRHIGSFFFVQLCCFTAVPSPGNQTSRREEAPGPGISLCSKVSKQMLCDSSNQHLCSVRITVSI